MKYSTVFYNPKQIGVYVSKCQLSNWHNSSPNTILRIFGNQCYAFTNQNNINSKQCKKRPSLNVNHNLISTHYGNYSKAKRQTLPDLLPALPANLQRLLPSTLSKERRSMLKRMTGPSTSRPCSIVKEESLTPIYGSIV